jgi:DNA-damage-inducible protein D
METLIAFAQTYFAIQTRKQEILEKRIGELERLEACKKLTQTEADLEYPPNMGI